MTPESEAYIKAAIDFAKSENPEEKATRDELKEEVIFFAGEVLNNWGVSGEEMTYMFRHGSGEGVISFQEAPLSTPPVEFAVEGTIVELVLSEELKATPTEVEIDRYSLDMRDPSAGKMVGRKSLAKIGVGESSYVTNFQGQKASIGDLEQIWDLMHEIDDRLENREFENKLPDVDDIYDPVFDSFSRSGSQE